MHCRTSFSPTQCWARAHFIAPPVRPRCAPGAPPVRPRPSISLQQWDHISHRCLGAHWGRIRFSNQAFQLKFFSYDQERVKILLVDIYLAIIEEINNGQKIFRLHTSHINQRMVVFVPCKPLLEERNWESQDHFVCFHLLTILTGQSHINVCPLWNNQKICLHFSLKLFHCTEGRAFLTYCLVNSYNHWPTRKELQKCKPPAYLPQYHSDIVFVVITL